MKRHEFDITSFVSGVIFLAVAVAFIVDERTDTSVNPRWVLPLVLVGIALAGLLATVQRTRAPLAASTPEVLPSAEPASAAMRGQGGDAAAGDDAGSGLGSELE
ncbi:MAG: hypothetical protein ABI912_00990 [Actinomycetota bacterium]